MSGFVSETAMPPAQVESGDLREVVERFNAMVERVDETQRSLEAEISRLRGELAKANEELARSERLAAIGHMAAGIAHEVRNPLGSIALYAKMLEEDLADRDSERAIATRIGTAVTGLDEIVTDVLVFAREIRVRPGPATVGELFDRALSSCTGIAEGGLDVRRDGATEDRIELRCDADLMVQSLANVIRNAIEIMSESGASERGLELEAVVEGEGCGDEVVALVIRDCGPGVDEETRKRMFNPFFTTRAAGTGLGLAIVHRIVEAHGGTVQVRNRPEGVGAEVTLRVPRGTNEESFDTDVPMVATTLGPRKECA